MAQEQEHSKIRFFEPYVGKKYYEEGVNGKKVLVLGASSYCEDETCGIRDKCTNTTAKNSEKANGEVCKYVTPRYNDLSKWPAKAIAERRSNVSHRKFTCFLQAVLLKENPWDYVAFTNYVQFIIPQKKTEYKYLSQRDVDAFKEVVGKLKPDVVIIWGSVVSNKLKQLFCITPDNKSELKKNDDYLWKTTINNKNVVMVSLYHPSYEPGWSEWLCRACKYVKKALI